MVSTASISVEEYNDYDLVTVNESDVLADAQEIVPAEIKLPGEGCYDRALLTVELSAQEDIAKSGTALVVALPVMFVMHFAWTVGEGKHAGGEKVKGVFIMHLSCCHIFWIVCGSIIMSSVDKIWDAAEATKLTYSEIDATGVCADTTYVGIEELLETLDVEIEKP